MYWILKIRVCDTYKPLKIFEPWCKNCYIPARIRIMSASFLLGRRFLAKVLNPYALRILFAIQPGSQLFLSVSDFYLVPVPFIYIGGELWEGRKKALWSALVRSNEGLEGSNKGKKKWKKNFVDIWKKHFKWI